MYRENLCVIKAQEALATFFAFCLFISFSTGSYAKEITLSTVTTAPLTTPELTGFLDLVAQEALARNGYQLKTIYLPAERALKNVNQGIEDGEMVRIKGMEKIYPNIIRVPEKIMDMEFVAFSRNNITLNNNWESLSKYAVSYINGWKIYEENVPKQAEITKVRTAKQLFSMLLKKRADIILYERWGGLLYIKNNQLKPIKLQLPALTKKEMFIYLNKKHKALVPKLAATLRKMKQDGSYNKIFNQKLMPLKK